MKDRNLALRLVIAGVAGTIVLAIFTAFVGPHSAHNLEKRLQETADAALVRAGVPTWRAKANGAGIELEGVAPSEEEKQRVVALIKAATGVGGVWADGVAVAAFADPFEWRARKESGRVMMGGHGPNKSSLTAIHEEARKLYGSAFRDDVTLASGAPEGVEWDVAAIKGLEALVRLERGEAVLRGKELIVTGVAANEADAQAVLSWLHGEKGGAKVVADIVGPAEWFAHLEGGRITLGGKAPSEDAQAALVKAAGGVREADDKTKIARTGAWQARARAALPHLGDFGRGDISVQGRMFRISGEAPGSVIGYLKEDMARIEDGYSVQYDIRETAPDMPELRGLDFRMGGKAALDACQAALNRATSVHRISFVNNRAVMERASGKAMDQVVAVMESCPVGGVRIEGHTDATGNRGKNIALSRDRAQAVRDYLISRGLSADRFSAVGFGPDRPVASNRTDSGRARNRRIEFRVIRGESN